MLQIAYIKYLLVLILFIINAIIIVLKLLKYIFIFAMLIIIIAFLLISFESKCEKKIEKKDIDKIIFIKKINNHQKKNNFFK